MSAPSKLVEGEAPLPLKIPAANHFLLLDSRDKDVPSGEELNEGVGECSRLAGVLEWVEAIGTPSVATVGGGE